MKRPHTQPTNKFRMKYKSLFDPSLKINEVIDLEKYLNEIKEKIKSPSSSKVILGERES